MRIELIIAGAIVLGAMYGAHAADNPLCAENRHSQALLIGNRDYKETFKVPYAHNDVAAVERFLLDRLCYRKGNIKILKNATFNEMREWLGTASNPRGRLWNRARKGRSNIFVYYSGHGVPDAETKKAYLLTVDTRPDNASFGYSLDRLDGNLQALNDFIGPRRTVTLVLDACFSGSSAGGALQSHSGAIRPELPTNTDILRFTASGAGQLAFWNEKRKLGLFTSVFLDGVSGEADKAETGNRDGKVSGGELVAYVVEEVSYRAKSLIGKAQTPTVPDGDYLGWEIIVPTSEPAERDPDLNASDRAARQWADVRESKSIAVLEAFRKKVADPVYRALADERIALLKSPPPEKDRCGDSLVTVGTGEKCLKSGDVFEDCDACPTMVVVPAGSFMMGSSDHERERMADEGLHLVTLPRPFAVGKFEVTFAEWDACVSAGGCTYRPKDNGWGRGRRPVINVSWEDTKTYVSWLSRKTGKAYRLLSEAEWEYAARAGTTTPFSTGRTITTDQANFNGRETYNGSGKGVSRGQTTNVGRFPANRFGLHDMHGNVWERVEDCWNGNYAGAPTDGSSRISGDCRRRVARGGAWDVNPGFLRSAFRTGDITNVRNNVSGFRVARTLAEAGPASTAVGTHASAEALYWSSAKNSDNPAVIEAFLAKFPNGYFARPARIRLKELKTRVALLKPPPTEGRCDDLLVTVGTGEKCLKPGDVFEDCGDCPKMVVVPAGSFMMGSPPSEFGRSDDEGPQRRVTIPRAFAVGKFEVTFAEWDACITAGGCKHPPKNSWGRGRRPVINVTWGDAKIYVSWLSRKTGKAYRLLSEAEWEYAARAGTMTPFSTGWTITTDQANFDGTKTYNGSRKGVYRKQTTAVGMFSANGFGLQDMHGNVWEWVEDCYHKNHTGAPTDGSSWISGNCNSRVFRGGSWYDNPWHLRSANRNKIYTEFRNSFVGFRVARTLTP